MGVVFSATHPMIGKRAAIKVLKQSLSNNPVTVERFIQEARAVNQIGHPNIVDIFAFGRLPDGRSYLVMDLLEGESLRKRVKRGPLTIGEAIHVIDEVASALAAAHAKGFIHRDLKPDNVFLVVHPEAGRTPCKLLDFGLAKLMPNSTHARAFRTATGAQLGTPDYMSPEQLKDANRVDARTDIYALGVLAFEILVGERPRRYSDGTFELDGKTVSEAIDAKARAPKELAQLVESMLAVEPEGRPTLDAVRAVLKRARTAVPSTSVIGLEVSLPPVRAVGTEPAMGSMSPSQLGARPVLPTPPTGAPTVVDGPARRRSQPPGGVGRSPPAKIAAGLRRDESSPVSTKLGVMAPPRPSRPHPVHASGSLAAAQPRRENRVWLIVAVVLVLLAGVALVFVLA